MLKSTLLKATQAGGQILQHYFNGNLQISSKSTVNDLVTEADKQSEKAVMDTIRAAFPDHFILSEEAGELSTSSSVKWIIDPLDGTVNFAHGIPICCVSIGVEKDGEMIMGAVYNPFMNEFFFAEKGQGATLNDQPIKVSGKTELARACLVTGFPYQWEEKDHNPMHILENFVKKGLPVRRLGSAAIDLCWVACGRFDAFYEGHLNAWDSAAGFLLVQEAGGKVTDYKGQPYSPYQPTILASNGILHNDMLTTIQQF
ncbi:inositol monophosphatase [Chitinophaga pendula]|uniref:inositol monophosphatase family protein n=1 Tax=Chitinophaga TaxID=79328 RepID=UPI000BB0C58D|nr:MULTISPECIES: inositol monophosphatase family protein [Chitinophaga]ASZ10631.1 inositol monophosphatase [Chitinophaga sp. MD30]UCJ06393.1 inositol monophosphatase [Chitinophaga pendula]